MSDEHNTRRDNGEDRMSGVSRFTQKGHGICQVACARNNGQSDVVEWNPNLYWWRQMMWQVCEENAVLYLFAVMTSWAVCFVVTGKRRGSRRHEGKLLRWRYVLVIPSTTDSTSIYTFKKVTWLRSTLFGCLGGCMCVYEILASFSPSWAAVTPCI